ncbi:hypothetical protein acdb102_23650 [Acidothermaceae bacterium B102]|nr:hypothetical protein acdb102_23650 [Acidothermaceae bacterium B102]
MIEVGALEGALLAGAVDAAPVVGAAPDVDAAALFDVGAATALELAAAAALVLEAAALALLLVPLLEPELHPARTSPARVTVVIATNRVRRGCICEVSIHSSFDRRPTRAADELVGNVDSATRNVGPQARCSTAVGRVKALPEIPTPRPAEQTYDD